MAKHVGEFRTCVNCKAIGVVWGGENPEWVPVEKDVCVSCVSDVVGRDKAMDSYRRLHPKRSEKKKRTRRRSRVSKPS